MRFRHFVIGFIALGIVFAFTTPASATSFDNRPKILLT
jgi:Na+-transporting NADH:ubiquinone oxidoreductase subunit NqrB